MEVVDDLPLPQRQVASSHIRGRKRDIAKPKALEELTVEGIGDRLQALCKPENGSGGTLWKSQ